jgi:hypothetical protein
MTGLAKPSMLLGFDAFLDRTSEDREGGVREAGGSGAAAGLPGEREQWKS